MFMLDLPLRDANAAPQDSPIGQILYWIFVFPNGTLANKAERLAALKSPPANAPISTVESVVVKLYGDVAVAIVDSKWTGTNEGKPLSMHFRATHVWARGAAEWKLAAAHVSQMKDA
jgi:Domain of unknown function (DUF4440)